MTTYDRVAHFVGLCCFGLLGLSANPEIYKHLPWWLIAAASVIGFAIQASTNPVMNKPTVGEAIEKSKIGVILLGLALCGLSSCTAVPKVVSTAGDIAVDCTTQATKDVAIGLLDDVASALATKDYAGTLEAIVTRWGIEAVTCAVSEVGSSSMHSNAATGDPLEGLKAQRARDWMASKNVSVK